MYLYVLFGCWYVFVHVLVRIGMFFGMNCFMLVASFCIVSQGTVAGPPDAFLQARSSFWALDECRSQ
jgi:hypothetical protein